MPFPAPARCRCTAHLIVLLAAPRAFALPRIQTVNIFFLCRFARDRCALSMWPNFVLVGHAWVSARGVAALVKIDGWVWSKGLGLRVARRVSELQSKGMNAEIGSAMVLLFSYRVMYSLFESFANVLGLKVNSKCHLNALFWYYSSSILFVASV